MQLLVRITSVYVAVAFAFLSLVRNNPAELFDDLLRSIPASLQIFTSVRWWTPLLIAALILFIPRAEMPRRLPRAMVAVFVMTVFSLTFSLVKTAMPFAVSFWADPMLASVDKTLHFGQAPWALAHRFSGFINTGVADLIYHQIWTPVAVYFPVFLFLLDNKEARIRRYVLMHAFSWVVLGNIVALAFMSGGPVFYDRIIGGDTFSGLQQALRDSDIASGNTGQIQTFLWAAFVNTSQSVGSGISAFPSLHLSMTTLIALYLFERWRAMLPVSMLIIATYLFLSVYLGWHYAIDGYVSIGATIALWAFLRKREARAALRHVKHERPVSAPEPAIQPAM